jgi:hypothetical protein
MWTTSKSDLFCPFNALPGYSQISKHMLKNLCILNSILVCVIAVNDEAIVLIIHLGCNFAFSRFSVSADGEYFLVNLVFGIGENSSQS